MLFNDIVFYITYLKYFMQSFNALLALFYKRHKKMIVLYWFVTIMIVPVGCLSELCCLGCRPDNSIGRSICN